SFYACLLEGTPTYSAHVYAGEGGITINPAVPVLEYTGHASNDQDAHDLLPSWPLNGAVIDFSVEVTRQIDCQPDNTQPAPGPPYSGIVQYNGLTYPAADLYPSVNASFYDGGAEQDKFDGMIDRMQRLYGIRDDRGDDGECVALTEYTFDDGEGGLH